MDKQPLWKQYGFSSESEFMARYPNHTGERTLVVGFSPKVSEAYLKSGKNKKRRKRK